MKIFLILLCLIIIPIFFGGLLFDFGFKYSGGSLLFFGAFVVVILPWIKEHLEAVK